MAAATAVTGGGPGATLESAARSDKFSAIAEGLTGFVLGIPLSIDGDSSSGRSVAAESFSMCASLLSEPALFVLDLVVVWRLPFYLRLIAFVLSGWALVFCWFTIAVGDGTWFNPSGNGTEDIVAVDA